MQIYKIRLSSLYSFGPDVQELVIDPDNPKMIQLVGENGTGKTNLMRLVKLLCYCHTGGVTIKDIAHDVIGSGWGEIYLKSNGDDWKIRMEFSKKLKIEIFKNGSDVAEDFGGLDETKKKLRDVIMDMPFHIFDNTLSLSVHDFKSFLDMKAKDSRLIRDRIFGFHIVNEMMTKLRKDANKTTTEYNEINQKITFFDQQIEEQTIKLEEIKISIISNAEPKKLELQRSLEEKEKESVTIGKLIEDTTIFVDRAKKYQDALKYQEAQTKIQDIEIQIANLKQSLDAKTKTKSDFEKEYLDVLDQIRELDRKIMISNLKEKEVELKLLDISIIGNKLAEISALDLETNVPQEKLEIHQKIKSKLDLQSRLDLLKQNSETENNLLLENNKILANATEQLQKGAESESRGKLMLETANNKLELLKKGICDRCNRDFQNTEEEIKIAEEEIAELDAKMKNVVVFLAKYNQLKQTAETAIRNSKVTELKYQIAELEKQLEVVKDVDTSDLSIENIDSILADLTIKANDQHVYLQSRKKEKQEIEKEYNETKNKIAVLEQTISSMKNQIGNFTEDDLSNLEDATKLKERSEFIKNQINTIKFDDLQNEMLQLEQTKIQYTSVQPINYSDDQNLMEDFEGKEIDFDSINSNIFLYNNNIAAINNNMNSIRYELVNLDRQNEDQINQYQNIIKDNFDKKKLLLENIQKISSDMQFFSMLEFIYSDEGIKSYILQEIIPNLNYEIDVIIKKVGISLSLQFDPEFTTHIYRNGKEVSVSSISKGQKDILNCAVILSITKILKMKYNTINLVFYDEVFSSLHAKIRPIMLSILQNLCKEQLGLTTIVVNHSYLPSEYFDEILEVKSDGIFSYINKMNINQYEGDAIKEIA